MKSLADLPNLEGFKFIGISDEGEMMDCTVVRDSAGCHSVEDAYGEPCFMRLSGWDDHER